MRHDGFVRELARRLVDAQAAEDVAQQTWLAALQAPMRPLRSMRAWLATIVRRTARKRSVSEQSRRRREQAVASDESAPSPADIVAREQARAHVVKAMLALPETYRDVVALRWFEGLPPRDIAQRLGIPVETVRTRHRRAMDQLRNALDQQVGGGRAAWSAALLPLVGPDATPPPVVVTTTTKTVLGGALLMSTKFKVGVAAVAVATAIAIWMTLPPVAPPPMVGDANGAAPHALAAEAHGEGGIDAADSGEIAALPSGVERDSAEVVTPTTGAVHVRVKWAVDGKPAANVTVYVSGDGASKLILTNAGGLARLENLTPGHYRTNIMRPDVMYFGPEIEQPKFEVTAGVTATIELTVPDALDVSGIVVDGQDRPIPDAEVTIGMSSIVVATTGADGRFAARDLATRCVVGARASGVAPSNLRSVQGSVGGSVELRFVLDKPGVRVTGVVLGPDAKPIAGARVTIGKRYAVPIRLPDGSSGRAPPGSTQVTDQHGRFSMMSVNPGTHPLQVTAPGLSRHREELTLLPGSKHDIRIHMLPGVTVHGVIRTSNGAPIANASVTTSRGTNLSRWARTNADGTYTIVGAASGELPIQVECGSFDTKTETLHAVAGQTLRWDPVLASSGIALRGRVLDADGLPAADVTVQASQSLRHAGHWHRTGKARPDGRFELHNCTPGIPLYLSVQSRQRPSVRVDAVLPEAGEHIIRVPDPVTVRIRGILLDDHGKPLPNVEIWAALRGHGSQRTTNDLETGAFALELQRAGDYMVWIRPPGFAPFRTKYRPLVDQDSWDLGELRMTRGGTVQVAFVGDHIAFADRYLPINGQNGDNGHGVQIVDGTGIAGPLAPGDYQLHLEGADVVSEIVSFRIRDGVQTQLDVAVRRGTPTVLQVEGRPGSHPPLSALVTVTNDAGTVVLRREPSRREGEALTLQTMLLPGKYRVEASTAADEVPGRVASMELIVATDPVTKRIEVERRN